MQIRIATKDEIETIRHIAHKTWPVAYGELLAPTQLAYMLELIYSADALNKQFDEGHVFFIAENEDGEAIGFAGCSQQEAGISWKLHKLYVLPTVQKSGAGKALLQTVIHTAKQHSASQLLLCVKRDNPAYNFYIKIGFENIGPVDIPIGEGYFMRDYLMKKEI